MIIFFLLASLEARAADSFGPTDLACAKAEAPALNVDTARVRWPFKAEAAKLVLEAKSANDAVKLECSRLQVAAADTQRQDATAFVVANTAVEQGRTVSVDARSGKVATDEAGVLRELPDSYGTIGRDGSAYASQLGWNLGFLDGQGTASRVGGSIEEVVDDAKARREEADAKAKAIRDAGGS